MSGPLRSAASKDDHDLLDRALAEEFGPNSQEDLDDALLRSATNGNMHCASRLIESGADPDSRDMDGCTPLMLAAANGYYDLCVMLIDCGADVDDISDKGRTALHMAIWNNRYRIARMLLLMKCDSDVRDIYGDTPFLLASRRGYARLLTLLIEHGCNPEVCSDELDTALHYAARYGHPECVLILIQRNPGNIEMRNVWGITPLLYAVQFSRTECARALIQSGACINATDMSQKSAIQYAAKNKASECCKLLIRKGANIDVSDPDGSTPLMDAISVNCPEVVRFLIQGGCNVDIVGKATVRGRYVWSTPFRAALVNGYIECAKMLYLSCCPVGEPDEILDIKVPVTKNENEVQDWLKEVFTIPRCLSLWCRAVVHGSLGKGATLKAKQLPIPKGLQLFVAMYDLSLVEN